MTSSQKSSDRSGVAGWSRGFRENGTGRLLLWDGGVGTALIRRGLDLAVEPPESWLLRRPAEVAAVHAEFAAAGVDVLQTGSFGLIRLYADPSAWPSALGPRPALAELVQRSVQLAGQGAAAATVAAAGGGPAPLGPEVIGCLGPTGRTDLPNPLVTAAYEAAAAAFAAAGVAVLHLETCLEPQELALALAAVARAAPELTLLVSLTLSMGQSGPETPFGTPLGRMLRELDRSPQPLYAVGVNCSQPARRLHAAVAALYDWSGGRIPVIVQPQVGEPSPDCRFPAKPESPERFARDLLRLRDEGAAALGGCCGAAPEHLRALRLALGELEGASPPPASL